MNCPSDARLAAMAMQLRAAYNDGSERMFELVHSLRWLTDPQRNRVIQLSREFIDDERLDS